MAIKPEARASFFDKYSDQSAIANYLDEAFDVSFGQIHGQLSFWLASPKRGARERFGLQKEVLVIFSEHATTDARVLTAIENITRIPEFKHRVDKILFFLIHAGDKEESAELARSDKERIIIPLHVDELRDSRRGPMFLRTRMMKALGAIDLFGVSSPLKSDKYFFGREEIVQSLVKRVTVQESNAGVFGLRKTGKTSVLFAVQRALAEKSVLCDYVDCQNPGVHAARWWDVLANLVERSRATLKREIRRDAALQLSYTATNAGMRFVSDMKSLLENGQVERVIWLLDEIEFITPSVAGALGQHWDSDFVPFWQAIRAAHQEMQGRLTFVVAGVNPATVDRSHFGTAPNPIFQLALPTYLEPLADEAIRAMVRGIGRYAGLDFDEEVYGYLARTYGGHPYLIRLACSEVWRAHPPTQPLRPVSISITDFKRIRAEIRSRLERPIKDILLSLVWWYPEEYELLQVLASGDESFVREYLRDAPGSLVQFVRYGLINDRTIEFAIADVKEFLQLYGDDYKKEISPFARSDMPMAYLPEIPDLAILGKMFEKRVEVELGLRRAIMLYLGIKCTWDAECVAKHMLKGLRPRPERPNPQSLFIGRTPQHAIAELYLLDLKLIVAENWDVFSPLFTNRTRFEMNMDTINVARRVDAHTKGLTEQERIDFENSYGWISARLELLPRL
jgi:hypothetical protein